MRCRIKFRNQVCMSCQYEYYEKVKIMNIILVPKTTIKTSMKPKHISITKKALFFSNKM